jgi:regulation of enolase protein 1 (concanavalin A-like superfamily)
MSGWQTKNLKTTSPTEAEINTNFSINASPSSDLWLYPDSTHITNIPMIYKCIPMERFKRVRVTLSTKTTEEYAQGGLVMMMNLPEGKKKWIKAGIEAMDGQQMICTAGKDEWPDVSLGRQFSAGEWVTIEMARKDQYLVIMEVKCEGGSEAERVSIVREIGWVFAEDLGVECLFGVYAAKPANTSSDVVVEFKDLVIEVLSSD